LKSVHNLDNSLLNIVKSPFETANSLFPSETLDVLRLFTPHEHIIVLLQLLWKLALFAYHVALALIGNHKSCQNIQRVLVNQFLKKLKRAGTYSLSLIIVFNIGCIPLHEVINEVDGTCDLVNAAGKQDW